MHNKLQYILTIKSHKFDNSTPRKIYSETGRDTVHPVKYIGADRPVFIGIWQIKESPK